MRFPPLDAGVTPVKECQYDFGYTDVKSFLATASILEGVGVSAYLGAAADIMSKTYLTAAGSILTVEARHSSYIRAGLKEVPFAQPFDAPLSINEVYSLASQFIVSCPPENPALPVKAFPKLVLDPQTAMPVTPRATVTLQTPVSTNTAVQIFNVGCSNSCARRDTLFKLPKALRSFTPHLLQSPVQFLFLPPLSMEGTLSRSLKVSLAKPTLY